MRTNKIFNLWIIDLESVSVRMLVWHGPAVDHNVADLPRNAYQYQNFITKGWRSSKQDIKSSYLMPFSCIRSGMYKGLCVFKLRCPAGVTFPFYFEENLGLFCSGIFRKQLCLIFLLVKRFIKILASPTKSPGVVEYLRDFKTRTNCRRKKFMILSVLLEPIIYHSFQNQFDSFGLM